MQNISDVPLSDDEEDEEYDEGEVSNGGSSSSNNSSSSRSRNCEAGGNLRGSTINRTHRRSLSAQRDYKWNPMSDKAFNKKKYYRNCLRCIKPLTMDDTWVSRSLVKPTTLSPLNMAYLRVVKYAGPNGELLSNSSSCSSLVSLSKRNGGSLFKESSGIMLPDTALTRIPNHFLKEYLVGSHGLVPREIM